MAHRHRVVIIGAGFGGLAAARAFHDQPVDVVVVDRNNFHTFQPLLYQVATAGLDGDDIAHAVRGIFHRQRNVDFRLGSVMAVDTQVRELTLADGSMLAYDDLIVAAGATTATFGVPGVDEHAFKLKSLADALDLRSHVLSCFERADGDPTLIDGGALTIVIAGAGPTGVELAGGMVELFDKVLRRDFHHLDVGRARVVLVEAAHQVLGTFHPTLSDAAARSLEQRGVELLLGRSVQKVEPDAVHLDDGTIIDTQTMVWTAGVRAAPLAAALGLETGPGGRIVVAPELSVPGAPGVWAVGDVAAIPAVDGGVLPQLAPVAMQSARHAAANIVATRHQQPLRPFRYRDKGTMATIGRHAAVAQLPFRIRLTGFLGWVSWLALHLVMLIGFRNRVNVLTNWAWNYLTYDRGARIIIGTSRPGSAPDRGGGTPPPARPPAR